MDPTPAALWLSLNTASASAYGPVLLDLLHYIAERCMGGSQLPWLTPKAPKAGGMQEEVKGPAKGKVSTKQQGKQGGAASSSGGTGGAGSGEPAGRGEGSASGKCTSSTGSSSSASAAEQTAGSKGDPEPKLTPAESVAKQQEYFRTVLDTRRILGCANPACTNPASGGYDDTCKGANVLCKLCGVQYCSMDCNLAAMRLHGEMCGV